MFIFQKQLYFTIGEHNEKTHPDTDELSAAIHV